MPSHPDPPALAAQRRSRIHALRTRIATIGVAAFLALWAGLFVQLATGHDPGLKDGSQSAVVQSADPAATDPSTDAWPEESAPASADGWPDESAGGWREEGAPAAGGGVVQDDRSNLPGAPTDGGSVTTRQS